MQTLFTISAAALLAFVSLGCTGDVETTEDSVEIEAEVPKVELGDEDPDMSIGTDDDIDIETPVGSDD